jgi:hypothetical protein
VDFAVAMAIKKGFSRRYMFRKSKYRKGVDRFELDLENPDEGDILNDDSADEVVEEAIHLPWLTEDEFIQKYRMSRESFCRIVDLIQDHPVFKSRPRHGRKQAPVAHQLMVFLKFIGTEGTGASNAYQRNTFAIGYGTSETYRRRVTKVLLHHRADYIK